ncbi:MULTISPECIES: DUF3850 domain-containing protein [Photorhabdus]|uniref:DUF3850 domain-containing protein n=1 Tax=Photorhabdus kayaii TaxID=230088 RepID=A0ABX0B314_9GAMM|nr:MULTISPECIES: DUF3850 domain-containing protein [Photorhabdus]MCC8376050.1 DUF3850 domain-containing protein [Photorhabdus bodei]MCT8350591.1 DUF3850 domain-containing protein [Photorhabdus kayaii]NDL11281.1 hypothetical protein [Photorhabdus kayaii]NDL24912.1 hypothetical protein [Photorhabdus kayaii]
MEKLYTIRIGTSFFDVAVSFNIVGGWLNVKYTVGDVLIIREYDYDNNRFTGRNLLSKIILIHDDPEKTSHALLRFERINPVDFFQYGNNSHE